MKTCRICYEPGNLEDICECRGSLQFVHRECIHHWIEVSNRRTCELCGGAFRVASVPRDEDNSELQRSIQFCVFTYVCLIVLIWSYARIF